MELNFLLPNNKQFRSSLILLLIFVETQLIIYEMGEFTDAGLSEITTLDEVKELIVSIRESNKHVEEDCVLDSSTLLKFYAFAIIVNKLLVSELDDIIIALFKSKLPKTYSYLDFALVRKAVLLCNNTILEVIKEQSHLLVGFNELDNWLNEIEI
jgi:hypothetical protein